MPVLSRATWTRRRVVLASVVSGLAIAGGAGAAYAASSAQPVETGYAAVSDTGPTIAGAAQSDCPYAHGGPAAPASPSSPDQPTPEADQ